MTKKNESLNALSLASDLTIQVHKSRKQAVTHGPLLGKLARAECIHFPSTK